MNRLCNIDKHRNVEVYGFTSSQTSYRHVEWDETHPVEFEWGSYWDRAKLELILMTVDAGTKLEYDISFSCEIAFKGIDGLNGTPVLPALQVIADEIERVVLLIESEAIKLGLIAATT